MGDENEYRYKYNGIEEVDDFGLDLSFATFRTLDPSIGRWLQVDPVAESLVGISPYHAMGNNPILYNDPNGDFIPQLVGAVVGATLNVANNWSSIVKNPWSAVGYAATGAVGGVVATIPGGLAASRAIIAGGNVVTDIASGNMPNFDSFGDVASYGIGVGLNAVGTAGSAQSFGAIARQSLSKLGKEAGKEALSEGIGLIGSGSADGLGYKFAGSMSPGVWNSTEVLGATVTAKGGGFVASGLRGIGAVGASTALGAAANGGNAPKHGGNNHNDRIDNWVQKVRNDPQVSNIRKNQWQVDVNGNTVGRNRPDLQFDRNGRHYNLEWDNSARASRNHRRVVTRNDPSAIGKFWKLIRR